MQMRDDIAVKSLIGGSLPSNPWLVVAHGRHNISHIILLHNIEPAMGKIQRGWSLEIPKLSRKKIESKKKHIAKFRYSAKIH